jgi:hypothetical protein
VQEFLSSSDSINMDIDSDDSDLYESDEPDKDTGAAAGSDADLSDDDGDAAGFHPEDGVGMAGTDANPDAANNETADRHPIQSLLPKNGVDLSRVLRVIHHLVKNPINANRIAYNAGSTAIFTYLCRTLEVEHSDINLGEKEVKRRLFHTICHVVNSFLCPARNKRRWPGSAHTCLAC